MQKKEAPIGASFSTYQKTLSYTNSKEHIRYIEITK
jgi:hypothetical protein